MMLPRLCAILALVIATSGCTTATTLSQLNTSYDALITKLGPPGQVSPNADDEAPLSGATDGLQARFGALAQDAYTLAGKASNPTTQAAAYRLAAIAAWQHDPNDPIVSKAETEGEAVCAKLPQGNGGAPRDCAILHYLPVLIAYERIANDLNNTIINANPPPDPDVVKTNLDIIQTKLMPEIDSLATVQRSRWADISSGTGPYTGLSDTTGRYFQTVAGLSACLVVIANQRGISAQGIAHVTPSQGYRDAVAGEEAVYLQLLKDVQTKYGTVIIKPGTTDITAPDQKGQLGCQLVGTAPSRPR